MVGGDAESISAGVTARANASSSVAARATGINLAGSAGVTASGDSPVGAALARFVAAYSQFAGDLGIELTALATLATNGAADLLVATGGGRRPGGD